MPHDIHEVFNQPAPLADVNLFELNRPLQDALRFNAPDLDVAPLRTLGALAGSAPMLEHARLANVNPPQLRAWDPYGHRIDEVDFHPSYHALMHASTAAGLHGTPWAGEGGAPHVLRAAGFMLMTECEAAHLCPVSMTYAATPALRENPAIYAEWGPKLTRRAYDPRLIPFTQKAGVTMGMGMTERQGGSDVRANTSQAVRAGSDAWGDYYRLNGHKWFMSAPMSDAFLVLAQANGGLTCFFLSRVLPDGTRNGLHINRLKDKLGNRANASAEVEFDQATVWRVGDEGNGVRQILEMGARTRLDCALGSAGLMHAAVTLAMHHCRQRKAFGKFLIDQPLMRNVLADLALESEAATALALRVARAWQNAATDAHERLIARVLTPVAKYWICKRAVPLGQEAMECLGGNGYIEESGWRRMARIYREMPVNSIWEGAGNIMALDLLRALHHADVVTALQKELAAARGMHVDLDTAAQKLPDHIAALGNETDARRLAEHIAVLLQATLLAQSAPQKIVDAYCAARLQESGYRTLGTLPDAAAEAILNTECPRN